MSVTTAPAHSPPAHRASRPAMTVLLACLGVFASYIPIGGVSVSLPSIQQGLGASTSDLQWITDAFILPMAAFILTFGLLGDLYGRKKVFLSGLGFFAAGSAVSLTANGVAQVWVGQALSGVGAAALLTSTLALISHVYPDFRARAKAVSAWAASLGLGMSLGPLVSGGILEGAGWRWIFLPALVVAVIGLVAGAVLLEDSRAAHGRAIDIPGQIAAVVTIAALVYGVIEGGASGWGEGKVVAAFVVAAVGLVSFVAVELRSSSPMLSMRLFRSRAFSGAGAVIALALFAQVGLVFALSLFFGTVQHLSALQIGLRFLALNGLAVILGPVVGRLMGRVAPGLLLTGGLVVTAAGTFWLDTLEADTGAGPVVLVLAVIGAGFSFVMAPITAIAVTSVPHHLAGMAGAGSNTLRQVGGAMGPAVFGVVLTDHTVASLPDNLAAAGLSAADRQHVVNAVTSEGLGAAGHLGLGGKATGQALSAFGDSFSAALHTCTTIGAVGMLVAAAVTVVFIGVRKPSAPGHAVTASAAPRSSAETVEPAEAVEPETV
ncbi:MFS transporter [Streptomyces sp. LP11]|uniref:MFS transporter n=1 Tax=Streptomyces pyxinicus TaxID=2970331 RepID=A0ABT2AU70_9ACTN|nr:MFS transporter [Streptomyces sp. LP11]MCS0599705.1 MFS transporter [Streptomyces sp. LP11]